MNTDAKTLEELVARARTIRDAGSDVLDLAGFWPLIEVAAANLPAPDYTAMSGPEMLHACRDDGRRWRGCLTDERDDPMTTPEALNALADRVERDEPSRTLGDGIALTSGKIKPTYFRPLPAAPGGTDA